MAAVPALRVSVWNCLVFLPIVDVHAALAGWMRFDMVLHCIFLIADANAALAGWMHRVCADLAGCYETSVLSMVRLRLFVALPGPVGRPSPMVTTASSDELIG